MEIYTNYYKKLISLNQNGDEPITDFNFMENSPIFGPNSSQWNPPENITPYDFLHGYCLIFAFALHKRFQYPIYAIKNENKAIVHYYCKPTYKNKPLYIDVRGITNDFDAFADEFEDFIEKNEIISHNTLVTIDEIENIIKKDKKEAVLQTAFYIIDDQPNGYNINYLP